MKLGPTKRAVCPGCQIDTLLHQHPDGWTCPDCGHVLEDHPPTLKPLADPPWYGRKATLLPPSEAREAIRLYRAELSINQIAQSLGRDSRRVGLTLHTYNVPLRERTPPSKIACSYGHRWTDANTLIVRGRRTCKACLARREAAFTAKLEERKAARARRIARRKQEAA